MTDAATATYIGQPLRRREDHKFITGRGRYTDDMKAVGNAAPGDPALAACACEIRSVDLAAARAAPGVRLVL